MHPSRRPDPADRHVPVLIVGGGGSGLTASLALSDLGVESLLVERHPGTSIQPKAHILNARTMEIFGHLKVADDVYREGAPPENRGAMVWLTSLGGDEPYDRKVLHRTSAYGGGRLAERYARASAYPHANLGQRWLEPLLRRHAEERAPGGLLFHHELTALDEDEDGVTATVLDRGTGGVFRVRAAYVVAADGGKTVGRLRGIPMTGTPTFLEWINLHVRADFSPFIPYDDAVVNRVSSLSEDGTLEHCGVVPMGPRNWGRHSEEWTLMFSRPPGGRGAAELDDETIVKMVRRTLKLPDDHAMDVQSISRWPVEGTVAERFRSGRVFLVGDAAHRHPPSGALGLNTGVQDAHNLAWKLALVLDGRAGAALLDSYEAERRPVAERVVERALFSLFNQIAFTAGTGVVQGARPEWNRAQLTALFSDTPDGETRRAVLREYFDTNRVTTAHLGLEMGYDYADAGYVGDDRTARPRQDPLGLVYVPSARPGARLPHAWLRLGQQRLSTHQLPSPPGSFLLLAGAAGASWLAAAERLADAYRIRIAAYAVGADGGPRDEDGAWARLNGHDPEGAVLVRPDGFVAMRWLSRCPRPADELAAALDTALARGPHPAAGREGVAG
ncbi:FAD-dependent monooxygenase [Streptomyces noursei]|uniref:FAD-dependent monooxygenase n=1 Tax=Streptomyces noursei TaxID=1971 RepID=UPI0016771066|nr:FAD-dependent monooxygenase [Streptomyces noursei]MCZ1018728.1 FAD-dependent monooxygenase [Streptomyces noursei]GGX26853.1 2,4-dichlorophenol 6-monooxygenase [Streptomyces noursei]